MATGKDPEAAILADIRNNGILDLIVANKADGTVSTVPVQYAAPVASNENLTTYGGQMLSGQ